MFKTQLLTKNKIVSVGINALFYTDIVLFLRMLY